MNLKFKIAAFIEPLVPESIHRFWAMRYCERNRLHVIHPHECDVQMLIHRSMNIRVLSANTAKVIDIRCKKSDTLNLTLERDSTEVLFSRDEQ